MVVVLERFALGSQWPTIDPFLFCAHHDDRYPAGNAELGPAAPLSGRDLGQDFAGIDGWRMYHGRRVAGFPPHPHRGFETVTYVRHGYVDHSDSLGAAARFGPGDVQWLTAGAGIVHSEMFPLLDPDGPNRLELFQIWLNLPRDDKLAAPHFAMLWDRELPRVSTVDERSGAAARVTVIAGAYDERRPPPPPPSSWAAQEDAEVAIWHVQLDPGARALLPGARHPETMRTLYVFDGGVSVGGDRLDAGSGAVVRADREVDLASGAGADLLVLQGRPIGEPVARYGPFVMNDRAGVAQALQDYEATGFGGWPWPSDEPVHGPDRVRFAVHPGGVREEAGA